MSDAQPDEPTAPPAGLKRLSLRYPASCVVCGAALAKGSEALHDPTSRTVRCIECPSGGGLPVEAAIDVGVAGASAQREYERRTGAREDRIKYRFGKRVGGMILAVTDDPQSTRAWAQGARGERALAEALASVAGIQVLHDRRVPGTRGNIDHIVVAPAGVFVVDAKHYEGLIRVRDIGGFFKTDRRLYVGRRDCSKLAENTTWQVEAVERAVRSAPADPMPPVTPVLCFVGGEWPLVRPPDSYRGVRLEGTKSLRKLVTRSRVFDDDRIQGLASLLSTAFPPK